MEDSSSDLFTFDRTSNPEVPLIERYLQETSKPLFQAADQGAPVDSTFSTLYQLQPCLTWSSQSHTSCGSGALSPPTESDAMYEGIEGRATSELSAPSPPYESEMIPTQQWDQQYLQHANFNLSYVLPRSNYINPSDINSDYDSPPPTEQNSESMSLNHADTCYFASNEAVIDPSLLPVDVDQDAASLVRDAYHHHPSNGYPELPSQHNVNQFSHAEEEFNRVPKISNPSRQTGTGKSTRGHTPSQTKPGRLAPCPRDRGLCDLCQERFQNATALQRHIRSSHRRPFTCVFHYAGCSSTFGAKNEWKRHVLSQHLGLYYWHCTLGHCREVNNLDAQGRSSAAGIPSHGSIFNRKDLYIQHVRRMHMEDNSSKKLSEEAEETLKGYQEGAKKQRCKLPLFMECPAVGCPMEFRGSKAWNERMEHVAGHLGRAASGKEEEVCFGGDHDLTLTEWAASADVGVAVPLPGGGWQYRNPLKGHGKGGGTPSANTAQPASSDQDAEGEKSMPEV